jgi:Domain of unknown function (DUF5658)
MPAVHIFVYLQLLDFLTTMVGFRLGASEASPFIAKLIHISSPLMGLAASKFIGLALGGLCIAMGRVRLVSWINYWYATLVVWNLFVLIEAGARLTAH